MWKEMSVFRRVMVLLMAAMILAFTVMTVVTITRQGVEYRNHFLRAGQEGDAIIYTGEVSGRPARWTVSGDTVTYQWGDHVYGPYRVDTDPNQKIGEAIDNKYRPVTICKGDEVIFRGGYMMGSLFDENGEYYSEFGVSYIHVDGKVYQDGVAVPPEQWNEPDIHRVFRMAMGPELTHKGNGIIWFLATVIAVVNILLILFPDFFFRLDFRYKIRNYEDVEPSDLALAMRPVSWVLLALGALVLYSVGLTAMP